MLSSMVTGHHSEEIGMFSCVSVDFFRISGFLPSPTKLSVFVSCPAVWMDVWMCALKWTGISSGYIPGYIPASCPVFPDQNKAVIKDEWIKWPDFYLFPFPLSRLTLADSLPLDGTVATPLEKDITWLGSVSDFLQIHCSPHSAFIRQKQIPFYAFHLHTFKRGNLHTFLATNLLL